jgi:uncharacterized protein YbjT (DUF2867 family)
VTYREITKIQNKIWHGHPNLESVYADAYDKNSLSNAASGCTDAYYLIHSMYPNTNNFVQKDILAAENMVYAVNNSTLKHIIYLGGLGGDIANASKHLKSRKQVGEILSNSKAKVTILQAAMIIGSGSVSFEILRYIVERLPIMITPKWIHTKSQPISIRNVINYLLICLKNEALKGKNLDIGGPEIVTYKQLMEIYSTEANLRNRPTITLPFNDPFQSSAHFLNQILPLHISIIKPLVASLRNETICHNGDIAKYVQQYLFTPKEAIRNSINETRQVILHENFQYNGWPPPMEWSYFGDPKWAGGSIKYNRWGVILNGEIDKVWNIITNIGGTKGWHHVNYLWKLRGLIDQLMGGFGIQRGRPNGKRLKRGDIIDCWRVTDVREKERLLLQSEIKLPGIGSLCFKLKKISNKKIFLDQIACFVPRGIGGLFYWQALVPIHNYVFKGMIKAIAKESKCDILHGPRFLKRETSMYNFES